MQKKLRKVVHLANFAIFFKVKCLLISSKAQQTYHVFQNWRTLWLVTKTLKFAYHKVVLLLLKWSENGSTSKIAQISHFFWFSNLHNLLERACKLNEKSYIFQETGVPEIHVQLFVQKFSKPNNTSCLMPFLHKKLWVVGKWNYA